MTVFSYLYAIGTATKAKHVAISHMCVSMIMIKIFTVVVTVATDNNAGISLTLELCQCLLNTLQLQCQCIHKTTLQTQEGYAQILQTSRVTFTDISVHLQIKHHQ